MRQGGAASAPESPAEDVSSQSGTFPLSAPERGRGGEVRPPLDAATFATLRDSYGAEFVAEMVDLFLKDAPAQVEEIRRAIAAGDAEGVRRGAHTLKSNAALFGALDLEALCLDLEDRGRKGAIDGATGLLLRIESELRRVADALRAEK